MCQLLHLVQPACMQPLFLLQSLCMCLCLCRHHEKNDMAAPHPVQQQMHGQHREPARILVEHG
jgi:hypothetical protein